MSYVSADDANRDIDDVLGEVAEGPLLGAVALAEASWNGFAQQNATLLASMGTTAAAYRAAFITGHLYSTAEALT